MKQNSSFNNSNNNKLLVLIVESGEKTSHAVVGDRLFKSLCQVYSLIYQVLDVMTDSGMERASTLSSLSVCFLPSMDYL